MAEQGLPWYVYVLAGLALGVTIVLVAPKLTTIRNPKLPPLQAPPVALNEEVWEWTDYRGNKRRIVVHREARG